MSNVEKTDSQNGTIDAAEKKKTTLNRNARRKKANETAEAEISKEKETEVEKIFLIPKKIIKLSERKQDAKATLQDLRQKRPKRTVKDFQAAKSQAAKAFPLQGFNALQGITSRGV